MSLDLTKVISQVSNMITSMKDASGERMKRFQCAMDTLHQQATNIDELKVKIAASKTTWLVADLVDRLDGHYSAPSTPAEFTTIATDGSQIDVDRHRTMRCYLLNIGSAVIRYGASPTATLDSFPSLYSEDNDLTIKDTRGGGRMQLVEGALLGIKRGVEECRHLSHLAAELPPESSCLALIDGSLILWGLEAYPEFVTVELLDKGFLNHLEDMRKMNPGKRLALASYISFPRSTDVVNTLRVAICPHQPIDCDRCQTRDCDVVAGVRDRELFQDLLEEGERSALFISQSSIVQKHYGAHRVYFFYLKTDEEVARVEIPQWAATDDSLLGLAHALILDQCQRGQGYPVVLSEAHEKAVVTAADREQFWQLVESSLIEEHIPSISSAKSQSKRTRWV